MEFKTEDLERVAMGLAIRYPNQVITSKDVIAEAMRLHLGKELKNER